MSRKRRSKPKPVRVALAERLSAEASPDPAVNPYPFLDELVRHHRPDLLTAAIAVVWRYEVKPDKDGRLWIGAPKKPGDLDRALHRGRVEAFATCAVTRNEMVVYGWLDGPDTGTYFVSSLQAFALAFRPEPQEEAQTPEVPHA